MFTDIYQNIKNTLFSAKQTMHFHTHKLNESIDNGDIEIIGCKSCPQLWIQNNRIPYTTLLKMDWELAYMIVDIHPNSKFANLYSGKIPKWNSFQGNVMPIFNPITVN